MRLARIAGLLYLAVAVLGGFSQLYVRPSMVEPGNAAATAENIASSAVLFRVGFITDLVSITLFLLVALVLYALLSPEIFFGLWLLPLGCLVLRSGYFPKVLGVLLMIGTASYLGDVLVSLLFPGAPEDLSLIIATPAGIAELAFLAWLSVMGTKSIRRSKRPSTVAYSESPAQG